MLLAACLLGLLLRLLLLGNKSLWLDEVYGMVVARAGQGPLWAGTAMRYHPPLFYALLAPWMAVARSPFALRLPFALLGVVSLPFVYALARALFDEATAITSLWLATLSPMLIWYSQELRSYSPLVLLALVATWSLVLLMMRPRPWAAVLYYSVALTAALYLHYDALLLIPVHALLVVGLLAAGRGRRSGMLAWLAGVIVAGLAYLPWLLTPGPRDFLKILASDNFYLAPMISRLLGLSYTRILPALVAGLVVVAVAATWGLWLILRRYGHGLAKLRDRRWLQIALLVVFVALLVVTVVPRAYTLKRHSVMLWPLVLIGFAWVWPWQEQHRTALMLLMGASLLASLVNIVAVPKDQWKQAAAWVLAEQGPDDVVLCSPGYMTQVFDFYAQGRVAYAAISGGDVDATLAALLNEHGRVWFAYHTLDVGPYQAEIRQWFDEHARLVSARQFFRVTVNLYSR